MGSRGSSCVQEAGLCNGEKVCYLLLTILITPDHNPVGIRFFPQSHSTALSNARSSRGHSIQSFSSGSSKISSARCCHFLPQGPSSSWTIALSTKHRRFGKSLNHSESIISSFFLSLLLTTLTGLQWNETGISTRIFTRLQSH